MKRLSLRTETRQSGFSLTELMVAITIGLIILGGTLQVFSASKQSFLLQEGVSRAQESGRMGIFILTRTLRHAGFYRNPSLRTTQLKTAFPAVPAIGTTPAFLAGTAVTGAEGGANPDVLAVRYQSHEDGSLLDCHGLTFDCLGNPGCNTDSVQSPIMGTFTFELSPVDAVTGTRSLLCRRAIPTAGPPTNAINAPGHLLEGVSDFQVRYGVDTSGDLLADRYLKADEVAAGDWVNVVSLRVTLVTNSVATVGSGTASNRVEQTYNTVVYLRD